MTPRQPLFRLDCDDRPAVAAVAALSPNTALVDAAPLIAELFGSFGIEVSAWPARAELEECMRRLLRDAT